jgi:NAD(P) transhydrogenase
VRGSILLHDGKLLWPPPPPKVLPTAPVKVAETAKKEPLPINHFQNTLKDASMYTGGLTGLLGLGMMAPNSAFTTMTTTLALSGIAGYHTVWGVTPALHSPLM